MICLLWSHAMIKFSARYSIYVHAPSRQRSITVRPKAPWYTSEIACQKRLRRKLEHLWRRTKSQTHRKEYQKQCCVVNDLLYASKQAYYCGKIKDNLHNPKFLFPTINKLLQMNTDRFAEKILKYALPFRVPSLILVLHLFLLLRAQLVSLPSVKWIAVSFINC